MNSLDQRLLNDFQHGFPLVPRPYAAIAERLGATEDEVLTALTRLRVEGAVSRIGPVFAPRRIGASTLAAMAVPAERLEAIAALVSAYPEVNHNYEREHRFNLWFVVTAPNERHLQAVLREIETQSGSAVMALPLLADYHIDLGFPLVLR
ncbi:MAG: Lrp/AsnC family transcriptional regulator [Gammaproteobacteria bacterium]